MEARPRSPVGASGRRDAGRVDRYRVIHRRVRGVDDEDVTAGARDA